MKQAFGLCADTFPEDVPEDKEILRNTLIAAANKLYLEQWISRYAREEEKI